MPAWIRNGLLVTVAAGLIAACNGAPPPQKSPQPVVVESPQPLQGPGALEVFPGTVRARVEADLSFRIGGKIAARKVDLGDHVEPGQVLAVLDPEDARLNLDAARAAVEAARADLWLAEEEERRYRDLKTRGHVGQSALDQRVNVSRLSRARLEQAESQLDLARNQSRYTELRADAAGVITRVVGEPGNVVTPGQPVLRLAQDGEREVRITVPEARIAALSSGAPVVVEILNRPGTRYAAKVRDLSPQADPVTRTYEARVTVLEPDEHVQLGATAAVVLAAATDGETFHLPATALGTGQDGDAVVWTVVTADDGSTRVQPRPVQVLQYLHDGAVVTGELRTDDRLVSAGVHRLVPGMAVRPIDRATKAAL